jgi:uncharacterized membrane protein YkoI
MKKKSWMIGAIVVLTGLGALTGGRALLAEDEHDGREGRLLEAVEILSAGTVAPETAVGTALEGVKGTALGVELEVVGNSADRHLAWKVEILAEDGIRTVAVDVRTGEIVGTADEGEAGEVREARELAGAAKSGLRSALVALRGSRPGLLLEMELDEEDGAVVFEAEIARHGRRIECVVDPSSGKVNLDDEDEEHESGGHEDDEEDD